MGSRTSPYLQSKLVLLACEHVFSAVPALVESLLGIQVSQSQVYRTTQRAAFIVDEALVDEPSDHLDEQLSCPEQIVYGMVDGSMLLTQEGWQETKVGRVFEAQATQAVESQGELNWQMGPSEYVASRGNHQEFIEKFQQLYSPGSACRQVFVTDGALWIGKWLKEKYPSATHILDYYHLKQKLALAAQTTAHGQEWLHQQENRLFAGRQLAVEQAVEVLTRLDQSSKDQLLEYLKNNRYRTRYDLYRQKGLMISSGPIEAAHRSVLQVRMKRSEQRWSERGCDKMILLRAAYKSHKFHHIIDLFRQENYQLAA